MLALFQETTTSTSPIVVEVDDNPVALVVSIIAIIFATLVGLLAWNQGRALRRIETREHEWEDEDRRSAHIQVTRENYQSPRSTGMDGKPTFHNRWLVRLTNTGRATATNVTWNAFDPEDEMEPTEVLHTDIRELDQLHPGEYFDLPMQIRTSLGEAGLRFDVTWEDERGGHLNSRLINW